MRSESLRADLSVAAKVATKAVCSAELWVTTRDDWSETMKAEQKADEKVSKKAASRDEMSVVLLEQRNLLSCHSGVWFL